MFFPLYNNIIINNNLNKLTNKNYKTINILKSLIGKTIL